jgi:hypothetical protein
MPDGWKCFYEFPTLEKDPIYIHTRDLGEKEIHATRLHGGHEVSMELIEGANHSDKILTNSGLRHSHILTIF